VKERTVDIKAVFDTVKIPSFGKTKGTHLFDRVADAVLYTNKFIKDELWLYNRRMLTGPDT